MRRSIVLAAVVVLGSACASGAGGGGPEPVPVYTTAADVPCEYEVMQTVRGSGSFSLSDPGSFERAQARALGRAGARVGASAVLVPEPDRTGTARRREVGGGPVATQFEGQAIRFIEEGCGIDVDSIRGDVL